MTNTERTSHAIIHRSWLFLKVVYGLTSIAVGLDKFFNYMENWQKYVSPFIAQHIPMSVTHFCWAIGIIEIIVGLLILSKLTRLGAYILVAWLLLIVVNLISMRMYYDIAARDLVMAAGALVLAWLSDDIIQKHLKQ
jgi:uncharacterized membrane protein YphA (DoxX/SURF4 family)